MTPIQAFIEKKAEEAFPVYETGHFLNDDEIDHAVSLDRGRAAFTAGAEMIVDHMRTLIEHIERYNLGRRKIDYKWYYDDKWITTTELINLYFDSLDKK
jgi:hypothetical protein